MFTPVSEALEEASLAALTSITKTLTGADDSAALDPFLTEIFASLCSFSTRVTQVIRMIRKLSHTLLQDKRSAFVLIDANAVLL